MVLFGGLKIWPHSHLPIINIPEYINGGIKWSECHSPKVTANTGLTAFLAWHVIFVTKSCLTISVMKIYMTIQQQNTATVQIERICFFFFPKNNTQT